MATGKVVLSARAKALLDAREKNLLTETRRIPEPATSTDFADLVREAHAGTATATAAPQPTSPTQIVSLPSEAALPAVASPAPLPAVAPAGRLGYSHKAMVDLMVERPDYTHAQLCAHFGRPASWMPSILASEAFQRALDERRHEVMDPSLTATLQERFKALAIRTTNVMMTKLDSPDATDFMVLKSGEIAFKALGLGQKHTEAPPPAPAAEPATESLAERLMKMMDAREQKRTVDVDAEDVTPHGNF